MKTVLLFANPIAGRGRGKRIAATLRTRLARAGFDVRVALERPDGLPDEAFPDDVSGIRAAIAVGGDGTLRGVAQRLIDRYATAPRNDAGPIIPPLLVVPLGTANLMGKHLGVDWRDATMADQVESAVRRRKVVLLDAATANQRLFLLMAGVGIDAHVVHELDRTRSGPIDLTSYALPAAMAFGMYPYAPLKVEIDGRHAFGPTPGMAFVGNVPEYGTGFPILPMARADDAMLDVCVLPCRSRAELLQLMLLVAGGEHVRAPGVLYAPARSRVRITSDAPIPVQIDGEAAGHTPLEIELMPTRIPFIVPE